MPLVVGAQVDQHVGHGGQGRQEPAGEGVGVDHHGDPGVGVVAQRAACRVEGLLFQQRHLPAEAYQGNSGGRRHARSGAAHEHLPDGPLQRLDALADRRRGDAQRPRGGVEAAVGDDRLERHQLDRVE